MSSINWIKRVEEDAAEIIEEAKEWSKDNPGENLLERFEEDEDGEPFYLHEFIDGRGYFIYLDSESLKDKIDCLNQLKEYEETDSGLWDGMFYKEVLNAAAFWTYKNALRSKVLEGLKNKI